MEGIVSSVSESFRKVTPAAIPAMLDCILTSTCVSSSSLFDSLLSHFSTLLQELNGDGKNLSSERCAYIGSYLKGLSHLLKILESSVALESFIWEGFIPLMKMVKLYEREMLHEIVGYLLEVVSQANRWELIETTLAPVLLRSIGISMEMDQSGDKAVITWNRNSIFKSSRESQKMVIRDDVPVLSLTLSCYILSCLLDSATESYQTARGSLFACNVFQVETFCGHLIWDLCIFTIQMLSQSLDHRSCTISLLLPSIFKAFASKYSFEVWIQGESCHISRQLFFARLWKCSRVLFGQGHAERRAAYGIISLYLSYFSSVDQFQVKRDDEAGEFDIRSEKEFSDEIKRGLVEKDGLIRKQSLYILKKVVLVDDELHPHPTVPEKKSRDKGTVPRGMSKRELWAEEEAKSLGVGLTHPSAENFLSEKQKWEAFILLYEMLDEYGTHLVEAAWNHQIMLLLQSCVSYETIEDSKVSHQQINVLGNNFDWIAILWERGLFHDNPHVRCLIMKSFLDIEWKNHGNCRDFFPESFVLGAFMRGLNDPIHHKDFGVKGLHSSKIIEGAAKFLYQYCTSLCERELILFLCKLASVARYQSLGRAGLMSLSECIFSASESFKLFVAEAYADHLDGASNCINVLTTLNGMQSPRSLLCSEKADLVDSLRFLVENTKQHFNPNYRLRVCEKVLEAAISVICPDELSLESLVHFIAALPREFTDRGGSFRIKLQKWLTCKPKNNAVLNGSSFKMVIAESLHDFPRSFTTHQYKSSAGIYYDDDDLVAWCSEAERWARTFFLHVKEEHQFELLFKFIKEKAVTISGSVGEFTPVKFLMLLLSLVHEFETMQRSTNNYNKAELKIDSKSELIFAGDKGCPSAENFANVLLVILEDLISFAESSCKMFWSHLVIDSELPGAVTGKLGGPSQRRLSSPLTTAVLQAIVSVKTVATVSSWCAPLKEDARLNLASTFLWKFYNMIASSAIIDSETSAEIHIAAYEALSFALKASSVMISSSTINIIQKMNNHSDPMAKNRPLLDPVVLTFLHHINSLLAVRQLARTRRAVLMNWKWLCLEAMLSIPCHSVKNGVKIGHGTFFSDDAIRYILSDLVESLENAGEDSVLPMLRSVRMVLDLLTSSGSFVSASNGIDAQMMWQIVRSSWILHISCNKRRVAPIAALLSAVLHASVFSEEEMHVVSNGPGPLKWFCEKVLEEGMKSPRTIRLAALHLSGLWLLNPGMIRYYMKELKLLTLYGSVAFDEDFEGELTENADARIEVSLLAKIPDSEMTEAYINTELYARVSVAVLFCKLANVSEMAGSRRKIYDSFAALEAGKLFLLELLDSVVNDKDLAKELYKKYSAIHRRKVRAGQMLCVLSRFVDQDIVQQVMQKLSISLYRNNMPAVRQYLETFAIHVYLKFPNLVQQHLVPVLCDYSMKTQALSSYVYIAANVMLHAKPEVQSKHLAELLPPIIPLLTSHHHTLRGFTQLLVYQVFCKLLPVSDSKSINLEKRCFSNLKSYLEFNPDCARLRASMEGYLDAFSPIKSVAPAGIFSSRVEDMEFECVPTCLIERVTDFLNDVREELRSSMAKDEDTLKNESLMIVGDQDCMRPSESAGQEMLLDSALSYMPLDFQRKFTLSKHEMLNDAMLKEDQLLEQILQSRVMSMEKVRANRQKLVVVASLIDRIPNLAGLARTCEVFKASSLAVSDANVVQDKQFQLISVTAEKWVPIIEVPVNSVKNFLEKKKREGFAILGLEQTANSIPLDKYNFPEKTVLVLGREKEGIPADIIHIMDACIEIPQLGVVRSLNVHVSGAIAIWEYTRQQRST